MAIVREDRKIEITTWVDVRDHVRKVNRQFADIIDAFDPTDQCKLVKATYRFGDLIVDNGLVQLPTSDNSLRLLEQSDLPKTIKKQLAYQSIPLFLTTKNDNEVFFNTGNRIVPLNLFHQGSLLGVFETIHFLYQNRTIPKWCVSAGVRSMLMLPRINDNMGLDRLRLRYNIPAVVRLRSLQDHWEFFTSIAHSEDFEQPWENEVLFFTKDWLTSKNVNGIQFKDYIYKQAWEQAQFSIGKIESSLQWEMFAEAISMRNLKPRPYLADHVKHILSIASGKSPAFRPLSDSQSAPVRGLQDAFLNTYGLKDYIPTLMGIRPLRDINTGIPVYYSLSFPTLLEGTPVDKSTSTIMLDMREIKLLIETLQRYVKGNALFNRNVIDSIDMDYFHADDDKRKEIKPSTEIFLADTSFRENENRFSQRKLCETSPFWRGCIRIKVKT